MRFTLTEEQSLLQASALDWLRHHLAPAAGSPLADPWPAFAELGWLGLPFSQAVGGFEGGPVETGLLLHAMGRYLVSAPYVSSIVVAGSLLQRAGETRLLGRVIEGRARLALACEDAAHPVSAHPGKDGWVLRGGKVLVQAADTATVFLLSAGDEDAHCFVLDAAAAGIRCQTYDCLDGGHVSDLTLDGVVVPGHARLDNVGRADIEYAQALGRLAACWGACGAMQMLLEQTLGHVTRRRQFGRALSQFQVVQHRLAEMHLECVEALALCESASMRAALPEADVAALAAAAYIKVARAADFLAKQAIQLHGAMGVCEELPVASGFRWLEAFRIRYGRAKPYGGMALQSGRFGQSSVLPEAA